LLQSLFKLYATLAKAVNNNLIFHPKAEALG